MHKLFFRNFFSILILSLLILFVITSSMFLFYSTGARDWREKAFDEFVLSVKNELSNEDTNAPFGALIERSLRKATDDRICGYIISDIESGKILTFGQTRFGRPLSDQDRLTKNNLRTRENLGNARTLNLSDGVFEIKDTNELPHTCPEFVSGKDIVGSLVIALNGKALFVIDIITDSPDTYFRTRELVRDITRAMAIALPVCFVISLMGAWIISSKASKNVNRIKTALTELSNGNENVKTGKFTSEEFNNIAKAINSLDLCLQADRRSRKAWLNSISHDLNTPVQAMSFLIDGMNDGLIKKTKASINELKKENENLAAKIAKVMLYSAIQSMPQTELSELDSSKFIADLTADKDVEVEIKSEKIVCDEKLITYALRELLDNAFKFKEDDSPVKVTVDKDSSNYIISVSDKGKLNKMQEESDPFEPWTKSDFSRNSEGSGLGLPIAGSAVRLHKGTASLSSKDGTVTAVIRWPFQEVL